jgi:hypothetical protein
MRVIDADIQKFFDTISWGQLRQILQRRMNDGTILRLIGMWLHVGVLEAGQVVTSENGVPHGAPISPILANIFLHSVLDEWFQTGVQPRMRRNCFLARFADDFVMGFSLKSDAERVYRVLPKRFERFGLRIHPEKSRLVQFSEPFGKQGKGPGSFAFPGVHALLGEQAQRGLDHQTQDPRQAAEPFHERNTRTGAKKIGTRRWPSSGARSAQSCEGTISITGCAATSRCWK